MFYLYKKKDSMKTGKIYFGLLAVVAAFMISSCSSPITLTTWKNPENKAQVSKVVIMPLFEKLEYIKPFEQGMDATFEKKGLKAIGSLDFLNPNVKYPIEDIKRKCDSLGVDGILVFVYKGTDKTENYVPQTTYVTGGYGGYWGGGYWGGGYYGGGVATTGGYWTTTAVIHLTATLYVHGAPEGIWTGDITVTDPEYVDQIAANIGSDIFTDWQKYGLLKPIVTGKK
jgi:hypothetical protein